MKTWHKTSIALAVSAAITTTAFAWDKPAQGTGPFSWDSLEKFEEFEDLKVWAMERGQKTLNICRSQSEKENMSRPIFFRYILRIWSTIVTNSGLPQKACCSPLKTAITALFLVSFVVLTHHIFDVQTLSQSYSNNI